MGKTNLKNLAKKFKRGRKHDVVKLVQGSTGGNHDNPVGGNQHASSWVTDYSLILA